MAALQAMRSARARSPRSSAPRAASRHCCPASRDPCSSASASSSRPAPPAPPSDAYVVRFEGKEHRIAGVATVGELRDAAAKACGLATCRLVYKGDLTKDPSPELSKTKLRPGAKCLVMRARR